MDRESETNAIYETRDRVCVCVCVCVCVFPFRLGCALLDSSPVSAMF